MVLDGRRTSVSSPEQPQPYRTLKESDSADGEEGTGLDRPQDPSWAADSPTEVSLLEGIFMGLEVETQPPISQAKSLEDLRMPPEEGSQLCNFDDYQRMNPGFSEPSWATSGRKPSQYLSKQLWGLGLDDMALPSKHPQGSPERARTAPGHLPPVPRRPHRRDDRVTCGPLEKDTASPQTSQSSITIPRPQGRKTPELGIVPPPPAPRAAKVQAPLETVPTCLVGRSDLVLEESLATRTFPLAPCQPQLLPGTGGPTTELLQPVRVTVEAADVSSDSLLAFLDPLKSGSQDMLGPTSPSPAGVVFPPSSGDLEPPGLAPFGRPLGYLSPMPAAAPPFVQASLNPFMQAVPLSLARPPGSPFVPSLGHAYSSSFITSNSSLCQPLRLPPNPLTLSMPNLFAQSPAAASTPPSRPPPQLAQPCGSSKIRTLPLAHSAARKEAQARLASRPRDLPLVPHKARSVEPIVKPSAPKDPFEDLLNKTKQEVSVTPGKVEQLRRQWETFE